MKIKESKDPKIWEEFIAKNQPYNFLQSFYWGEFLKSEGKDVRYFELYEGKTLQAVVLVEKKMMARGVFYFESLWGPVWSRNLAGSLTSELLKNFYLFFKSSGDGVFWRLSPPASVLISPRYLESSYYFESGYSEDSSSLNFFPSLAKTRPPQKTLVVDLTKSEEAILDEMKAKTRYNINLSKRKEIEISWSRKVKDLKDFWKLNLVTAERGRFTAHDFNHYLRLLKAKSINPENHIEVVVASHKGKVVSANLVLFFNKVAFYLHGASSNEHRNLMSTYLLHFEIMKKAKAEGFEFYDFWGIDEKKWPGVTKFKEGFGGKSKDYPPLYELPLKNYYYKLYRLYKAVR